MTSYVRAIYDFNGEPGTPELSIAFGEVLQVTRTDIGDGWWEGKNNKGHIGLFPAAYVKVMSAAEAETQIPFNFESSNRYDKTDDLGDGEDWEDDWDNDNDTYSEIEKSDLSKPLGLGELMISNFENKSLPAAPVEDYGHSTLNYHSSTLKKSGVFAKSSDSYILGLTNKEKLPESEIVHIIVNDNFYFWKPIQHAYSVLVTSPKKESKFKGMKTFIAYQLTPSFTNISVFRRYKHFDWLHERLIEKFCLIPIPPLPDKQISGRYEEQFVEHRRVQLQEFVDWVCRHPVLSRCEVWNHFLTCNDDKVWKSGKRKAEKDTFVGVSYCLAINAPEKQLLPSFLDPQIETSTHLIHAMDVSIRNLLTLSNENAKRCQTQNKKDFQRIGEGFSELAKALHTDEIRAPTKGSMPLSEAVGKVSGVYIGIGQLFGEQPKNDWIPFSDRLHIYRGVLSCFPDIFSTHKGAFQKKKECERLVGEQKMNNAQLADVNRRIDVMSYAVLAELSHFKQERDTHLKNTFKTFIEEQIKFYSTVVRKLQEASRHFD